MAGQQFRASSSAVPAGPAAPPGQGHRPGAQPPAAFRRDLAFARQKQLDRRLFRQPGLAPEPLGFVFERLRQTGGSN